MAIKDQLPASNLGFTDMADTYGVARTADLGAMYKNGNVNMFSRMKPTDQPDLFVDEAAGIDSDRSLVIPLWTDMNNLQPPAWSYRRPSGGATSPYRGGDSAGYYRLARAFVTSGYVGSIAFEWSIRASGNGTYGPTLTLSFTPPAHAGNLQAGHVKQHGEYLSRWYWSVMLKGKKQNYLFVAGEPQLNGLISYRRLGDGNGNVIHASLTAQMADDLKEGTAVFFLWLPNRDIGGLTFDALQQLLGSGKKVGVYAGRDPGTGDVWINPVPLAVSRRTGNVLASPDEMTVNYDQVSTSVGGYAAYPVKVAVLSGNGVVHSAAMNPEEVYTPDGINFSFSISIPLVPNDSRRTRQATLVVFRSVYPSAAIAAIPADDKATIEITQRAAPMEIAFNPKELVIEALAGHNNVFIDCPSDGQWYVRSITETPEVGPTGGNFVPWITKLMKLGTQDGVIDNPTELPINPAQGYVTGPAYVQVVCTANTKPGAADRTAYIHLSHSDGYDTLKVTQVAHLN